MRDWILVTLVDVVVIAAAIVVVAFAIGVRDVLRERRARRAPIIVRFDPVRVPSLRGRIARARRLIVAARARAQAFDDEPTVPRAPLDSSILTRAEKAS